MKKKISVLLPSFLLALFYTGILLFYYWDIDKVYFQQDEWHALGKTIYYANANFLDIFVRKFAFHYIPVANIYFVIEYLFFGIEPKYYLFFGIFLQSITGVSFYILLKKMFKNSVAAFVAALLFITNFEVSQVIMVEMISFYTLSLLFVNILFIKLYDFITSKSQTKNVAKVLLVIFFILAILTHEAWFALVILIPLFILMFRSSEANFNWKKGDLYIVAAAVLFILFRLALQVLLPMDGKIPPQPSGRFAMAHSVATLPFKATTQYIVGFNNIFSLSRLYQNKMSYYRNDKTVNQDLMATTIVYDMVVYYIVGFLLIALLLILFICKASLSLKNKYIRAMIFGIGWIVTMSVIISAQKRFFNSIDSRYMYLFGEGIIIFTTSLILYILNNFKNVLSAKFAVLASVLLYVLIFGHYSYFQIRKTENAVVEISRVRSSIISQIKKINPSLNDKTVVYLKCSDDCLSNNQFGMPADWIVPFQNGFGWTLLVVYSENDPKKYAQFFSRDSFLWERYSTGYKEINGNGFGYFTNASELRDTMRKYHLNKSNLLALKYESKKFIVKEMTDQEKELLLSSSLL